jgi:hypothetical protein
MIPRPNAHLGGLWLTRSGDEDIGVVVFVRGAVDVTFGPLPSPTRFVSLVCHARQRIGLLT